MRVQMLTAKYCKIPATYYKRVVPTDVTKEIYFDSGVPFYMGITNSDDKLVNNISVIRTQETSFVVHTFRELDFEQGDKIRFDNRDYFIESINSTFYETTQFKSIKRYFITIK